MAEPWSSPSPAATAGDPDADRDTIAILQQEIARLDEELRLRDEEAAARDARPADAGASRAGPDEAIGRLNRDLADREETIALLLEQIRLAEEAEAAGRAEWEQLHRWVAEVERRVDDRDGARDREAPVLAPEAERRLAEALRQAVETERLASRSEREALIAEVERLRGRIAEVAGGSDTTAAAVRVPEEEGRPPREVDALVDELRTVRDERDAAVRALDGLRDESRRERNEHEAALNALRSQLARESLRRQQEQGRPIWTPEGRLDSDERIRAFREHLREIHDGESEQGMGRALAARLSRLWRSTGPDR